LYKTYTHGNVRYEKSQPYGCRGIKKHFWRINVARITVEDCLRQVPNRFMLVNMVAKRVRQIREGSEYLVNSPKNEDVVVSLREIAAGKLRLGFESDDIHPEIEMTAIEEVESMMAEKKADEAGMDEAEDSSDVEEEKETK